MRDKEKCVIGICYHTLVKSRHGLLKTSSFGVSSSNSIIDVKSVTHGRIGGFIWSPGVLIDVNSI